MFCIEINHSASNQTCLMNLVLLLLKGNVKSNTYLFVCLFIWQGHCTKNCYTRQRYL